MLLFILIICGLMNTEVSAGHGRFSRGQNFNRSKCYTLEISKKGAKKNRHHKQATLCCAPLPDIKNGPQDDLSNRKTNINNDRIEDQKQLTPESKPFQAGVYPRYNCNLDSDSGDTYKLSYNTPYTGQETDLSYGSYEDLPRYNYNFRGKDLSYSQFENCKFYYGDFTNTNLDGVIFSNCIFDGTEFQNASLKNVSFKNCKIFGMNWKNADVANITISEGLLESLETLLETKKVEMSLDHVQLSSNNLETLKKMPTIKIIRPIIKGEDEDDEDEDDAE